MRIGGGLSSSSVSALRMKSHHASNVVLVRAWGILSVCAHAQVGEDLALEALFCVT